MFKSFDIYKIKIYSPLKALELAREKHIPLYDFTKTDEYEYEFKVAPQFKKDVIGVFSEAVLIERKGPYAFAYNLVRLKTTLISIIIAVLMFVFASTRVYNIKIEGGVPTIDTMIVERLKEENITKYGPLPKTDNLTKLTSTLESELSSYIEFLEIKKVGLTVQVKYEKRREPVILPEYTRTLVAKRDGVIANVLVERGLKMVQENDFVKKGAVLISDKLTTTSGTEYELFTRGIVMAYTYRNIEITTSKELDPDTAKIDMLQEGDYRALIDADKGKIIKRNILDFMTSEDSYILKLHYQILENIAIEDKTYYE